MSLVLVINWSKLVLWVQQFIWSLLLLILLLNIAPNSCLNYLTLNHKHYLKAVSELYCSRDGFGTSWGNQGNLYGWDNTLLNKQHYFQLFTLVVLWSEAKSIRFFIGILHIIIILIILHCSLEHTTKAITKKCITF